MTFERLPNRPEQNGYWHASLLDRLPVIGARIDQECLQYIGTTYGRADLSDTAIPQKPRMPPVIAISIALLDDDKATLIVVRFRFVARASGNCLS